MTLRLTTVLGACLAAAMICGNQASVAAVEVVHFTSAVLPPSPFKLRQAKAQGKELKQEPGLPLWGHLNKPVGTGPFPALVLLHGCSGIFPSDARWASQLTDLGYVTLMVDSLGPRSVFDICKKPMEIASPDTRALDAHGALTFLQDLSFVDATRVGVAGWSHGGTSALAAVNKIGITSRLTERFKAAIAFYPYCYGEAEFDLPILVLIGEKDEWSPHKQCQALMSRSQNGSRSVDLVVYPGAFHAFDVPELEQGMSIEGPGARELKLLYDKEAHRDATERIRVFLSEHLLQ